MMTRNEPTAHSPLHRRVTAPLFLMLLALLGAGTPSEVAAQVPQEPLQQQAEAPLIAFDEDLQARLDALVMVGRDYAHWDDAWRFATGARQRFPGEGLLAPALSRVGIRHMLVVNRRFQPRLSLAISGSPLRQSAVAPDPTLRAAIRSAVEGGQLAARGQDLRGLALIDGQPSLIAAIPVVRESGNATAGGWLAFTEPLAGEASEALLRMLGPSARAISGDALATEPLPPPVRAWLDAGPPQPAILSHRDSDQLGTWLALRDLAGRPLWVVQVDTALPAPAEAVPEPSSVDAAVQSVQSGGGGKVFTVMLAALAALALMMWRGRRAAPPPALPATRTSMPAVAAVPPAAALPAAPAVPVPVPQKPPRAKTLPDAADIVESAPDGVLLATVSGGRILRANPAALRLFGLSEAELKTQGVMQLLRTPPEHSGAPEATLCLETSTHNLRRVLLDASGALRDVEVSVAPLQLPGVDGTAAIFIREAGPLSTESAATRVNAEELTVHYQPVIDFENERVCSLEALPLWKDTAHGWIHPDDPLSIIGEDGTVLTIGRFVLETVARDIVRWRGQNAALVPVSINVAVPVTDRDDVVVALRRIAASGIARELLQFEIMDEALMDRRSGRFRAELLRRWREPGLAITVDHYGARSRLLTADPEGVDALKLDPGLVRDIATDLPGRAAIETLVQKTNDRNIPVIAEGVDRWQQIEILRALGCRQAQGPLFSRPIPADEALRFLRGGRLVLMKRDPLEDTDELPALRLIKP